LSNKELREQYFNLFNMVKKIINECDPIGLLPSAPDDEYEMEIGKIVPLLNKIGSENALTEEISKIFNKAFGWDFTNEKCLSIAKKIWEESNKII
jgi:hypothetical protein